MLKVKCNICIDVSSHGDDIPPTIVEVEVPIPEKEWESELGMLVDEIEADIENATYEDGIDEDDFADATGYYGMDGYAYDCNPVQSRMAYHLMNFGADMATIMSHCSALGALRDALVAELEANQPEKIREIQMLKDMKDLDADDDEDEDDWNGKNWDSLSDRAKLKEMITGEYPLDLLDELARRVG